LPKITFRNLIRRLGDALTVEPEDEWMGYIFLAIAAFCAAVLVIRWFFIPGFLQ
jgi:hypothetical protein